MVTWNEHRHGQLELQEWGGTWQDQGQIANVEHDIPIYKRNIANSEVPWHTIKQSLGRSYRFTRPASCSGGEHKYHELKKRQAKTNGEFKIIRELSSYVSSYQNKAWNNIKAWTRVKCMTSVIPVQCSTNWAIKPTASWLCCDFMMIHIWLRYGRSPSRL